MKSYLKSDGTGWNSYKASRILQRAKNLKSWKELKEDNMISRITSMAIKDMRKSK